MAIVRDGHAPYTSATAVLQVIEGFRHRSPATPVTIEVLELLGVGAAIAPRTLQALKLLDLLNEEGNPTDALRGLREASPEELPDRLAAVVRAAYAEVFAYNDPATDPPERIIEAFRMYTPASLRPRMVRLFYGLCHAAGIIADVPTVGNAARTPLAASARRRNGDAVKPPKPSEAERAARAQRAAQEEETRRHERDQQRLRLEVGPLSHLHPALVGLLATIPPADEAWPTRERFEHFKTALDATLQISNPIPPRERDGEQ